MCPTEIIAFSDRADEFAAIDCQVIAASCDSHFSHLAWVNTPRNEGGLGKMQIPLFADKSGAVAKEYGVYNETSGIPYRGLFIIDGKGNLRQITINDLPVGRSVDETLRLVQAFQYTDKYGEGKQRKRNLIKIIAVRFSNKTNTTNAIKYFVYKNALSTVFNLFTVCPANWKPGSKTINPAKSQDYFKTVQ